MRVSIEAFNTDASPGRWVKIVILQRRRGSRDRIGSGWGVTGESNTGNIVETFESLQQAMDFVNDLVQEVEG